MSNEKIKILTVKGKGEFTAGPKAPSDIITILEEKYNAKSVMLLPSENRLEKILYRIKIFKTMLSSRIKNEILIMQFPMYETSSILNKLFLFSMKFMNKEKSVVLIHDLDSIRTEDKILKQQEIQRLNKVKYIISHNKKMTEYLKNEKINAKIINLELFDYLCDRKENYTRENNINKDDFSVIYAGNLKREKSPFIYQIEEDKLKFKFHLYGIGREKDINSKLKYKGKFSPNELPDNLEGDLGLIWDGSFDESDENKTYKVYTKYNNPHKLSCYVAAGIPVIAWEKAAIADFIKKYDIGYTIKSIYDINNLDFKNYNKKQENIRELQKKVRSGYFTKKAINNILKNIEK